MLRLIFFLFSSIFGVYTYFLAGRILRFRNRDNGSRRGNLFRLLSALLVTFLCSNLRSVTALVLLHFFVLSMLCDLAASVIRILTKSAEHKTSGGRLRSVFVRLYRSGAIPLAAALLLLGYGYYNMQHVVRTEYRISTQKQIGTYKMGLLADLHFGTIQDAAVLQKKVEEINQEGLDFVILCGDIVEEGTTRENMELCFQILGQLDTKYGVCYVYGNHDRQPYTASPSYTPEELSAAIVANHITILEDDCVEINGELVLAGRADAKWGDNSGRASTETVLNGADREKYIIVADHQPVGAQENDSQGVDLQVSGHTHDGQIWPVGVVTRLMGDLTYGEYQIGGCTVVVTSGFTGWGYPIRTEGHCEYVVLEISPDF